MQTYQGMNERIVGTLRMNDDHLYAALRIEEFEQQLREAAEALAMAQARIEELEQQLAQVQGLPDLRITYICARCGAFAEVPFLAVEVFDSGTTLVCSECGGVTVFDLNTPAQGGRE